MSAAVEYFFDDRVDHEFRVVDPGDDQGDDCGYKPKPTINHMTRMYILMPGDM